MRLFLNYVTTSDMKEPTTTTWIKSFSIMFLFSISFGNYIVAVLLITREKLLCTRDLEEHKDKMKLLSC